MKTTNKILIIALAVGLLITTYFLLKIKTFVQITELEVSGVIEFNEHPVNDFQTLEVRKGILVNLVQSDHESLTIECDTSLNKYLEVWVEDNKLHIGLSRNVPDSIRVKAHLKAKTLSYISLEKGAKLISNEPFVRDTLQLEAHGGGKLKMNLSMNHLQCKLSSGAKAELRGTTKSLKADANSGAQLKGKNLITENAQLNANSGAQIYVFVTGNLDVKASSGGQIKYYGEPKISNMDISSGGKLSRKN